jgi:hypothetical protein
MCHVTFVEGRASRGMRGVGHKQPRYKLFKVSTLVHATYKLTVQQNIQTDYTTDACKHATYTHATYTHARYKLTIKHMHATHKITMH